MLIKFKFKASEEEYENFKKIFSNLLLRKCNLKIYSFYSFKNYSFRFKTKKSRYPII